MINNNSQSYKHEVKKSTKCCHPDSFSIVWPSGWPEIRQILISVDFFMTFLVPHSDLSRKKSTTVLWKHFQTNFLFCQTHNLECINNASNKLDYNINRSHRTVYQPSAMSYGPHGPYYMGDFLRLIWVISASWWIRKVQFGTVFVIQMLFAWKAFTWYH